MIFPLGTACNNVIGQEGGGMKFFCFTRSIIAVTRGIGNFAKKFMARAVEDDNRFAAFDPQHVQRMVCFASLQPEDVTRALFGRQIKTMHEPSDR